jgi:hypothetical protein
MSEFLQPIDGVRQFRTTQLQASGLRIQLVFDSPPSADQLREDRKALIQKLGEPIDVELVATEELPSVGGKSPLFVSELPPGQGPFAADTDAGLTEQGG